MEINNKDIQSEIIRQRTRESMTKELRNQLSRKQIEKCLKNKEILKV